MKKYRYVGLLLAVVMSVFVFSGTAFAVPDENTQWLMEYKSSLCYGAYHETLRLC